MCDAMVILAAAALCDADDEARRSSHSMTERRQDERIPLFDNFRGSVNLGGVCVLHRLPRQQASKLKQRTVAIFLATSTTMRIFLFFRLGT